MHTHGQKQGLGGGSRNTWFGIGGEVGMAKDGDRGLLIGWNWATFVEKPRGVLGGGEGGGRVG